MGRPAFGRPPDCARCGRRSRVKGLEQGADDYLVKPFAFSELLARMRTILLRGTKVQPAMLRLADLEIDFVQHRAVRAGKKLDLTPKEFALLSLLVRRRNMSQPVPVFCGNLRGLNR